MFGCDVSQSWVSVGNMWVTVNWIRPVCSHTTGRSWFHIVSPTPDRKKVHAVKLFPVAQQGSLNIANGQLFI